MQSDMPPRRRAPPQYHPGMTAEETVRYIRAYKEWFEEDRTVPPEPAPLIDAGSLIAEQVYRRTELEEAARRDRTSSGIPIFTTIVGFAKHSSTTPIERLEPSVSCFDPLILLLR